MADQHVGSGISRSVYLNQKDCEDLLLFVLHRESILTCQMCKMSPSENYVILGSK